MEHTWEMGIRSAGAAVAGQRGEHPWDGCRVRMGNQGEPHLEYPCPILRHSQAFGAVPGSGCTGEVVERIEVLQPQGKAQTWTETAILSPAGAFFAIAKLFLHP